MPRSVAELLPRPFADLTIDDVAGLTEGDEERETLYLELKQQASNDAIAKSCAAFANSVGGLLVIGVDNDGEVVGVDRPAAEPQLWLKDVLRPLVLPLPPFRARWLPLEDAAEGERSRGVLLALVEESSTTPHLLMRKGAIYIRNPGSSDPVPISDQRRLLELLERGNRAQNRAIEAATAFIAGAHPAGASDWIALVLAPTGISASFAEALLDQGVTRLRDALDSAFGVPGQADEFRGAADEPVYTQGVLSVVRNRPDELEPRHELARADRTGAISITRGHGEARRGCFRLEDLQQTVRDALREGRNLLLDLGAHGDVRYRCWFFFRADQSIRLPQLRQYSVRDAGVAGWTTLDADEDRDSAMIDAIFGELARAAGVGPAIAPRNEAAQQV